MKDETKKKILLGFICIFTLLILFTAIKINENKKNNDLSVSLVHGYLEEVTYQDISTYVIEEPNAVIYVSNSSDDNSKKFEKIFMPLIKKYNLENKITYININNIVIDDLLYQNAPELIFYSNSVVNDVIDVSTLSNEKQIEKLLRERSVIGD